jgi:hypothetical protein
VEGDTTRGRRALHLDRRAFVRLSACGAGLVWATPSIRSVAPARAGTPPPTPTSAPPAPPPEVASEAEVPSDRSEQAAGATGAQPEVHAQVLGVRDRLAVTGTEIGQMAALGAGALVGGFGLRYVAGRMEAGEVQPCPPDTGSPDAQPG